MVPPSAPRTRALRLALPALGLLLVVAVLVAAAVLAAPRVDAAARTAAQERVAARVVAATGAGAAVVRVRGGAFLPQVLRGRYPEVDVRLDGLPAGQLRVRRLDAVLRDVRVPLSDVLRQRVGRVPAASATGQAHLGYGDLDAYLAAQGRPLRVAPPAAGAPPGDLRVTGTADVLGQRVSLSGDVDLSVRGGDLRATARSLSTGNALLDRLSRTVLGGLGPSASFTVPLGSLPLGAQLTGVSTAPDEVVVATAGRDVVLAP